jgi:hypothetical protein
LVEEFYRKWLFEKLGKEDKENSYRIDYVTETFFPGTNVITLSSLYWFLYKAKNTDDSRTALEVYYKEPRPFGFFGGVTTEWSTDSEDSFDRARVVNDTKAEAAIKLFATLHQVYFRRLWDLDSLIKTASSILAKETFEDRQKERLENLKHILEKIRDYYSSIK